MSSISESELKGIMTIQLNVILHFYIIRKKRNLIEDQIALIKIKSNQLNKPNPSKSKPAYHINK